MGEARLAEEERLAEEARLAEAAKEGQERGSFSCRSAVAKGLRTVTWRSRHGIRMDLDST